MSGKAKTCYLRSKDGSHKTIYLPDGTPTIIGRSIETNITDLQCSRQQVRLCANYKDYIVTVQQIGTRPCGVNGFKTRRDNRVYVQHNDCVEVLYGKHVYQIEFNPPKALDTVQVPSRKRSYLDEEDPQLTNKEDDILQLHKIPKLESSSNNDNNTETSNDHINNSESNETKVIKMDLDLSSTSAAATNNVTTTKLWEEDHSKGLFIYSPEGLQNREKIAAYDMDGTLIKTKSGLVFPKDCNDWQLLYPTIPNKLKQLHADNYKIVIFTNQGSIGTGKVKVNDMKQKIKNVVNRLGVPIQVFIAGKKNIYRKPTTGMWDTLVKEKNGGIVVDKSNSFYVGDAAGRPKSWAPGKKKDHSSADRLMALNIGLRFQTPDEHFLSHKVASYVLPTFNPKTLSKDSSICSPSDAKLTQDKTEAILMVGCPGSGKSHFVKTYLADYKHVNRDTLGSWQKCIALMEQALNDRKNVVIDNTNPDPASRQKYIEVAKKHNVPIRCFVMATTIEHAKHNNKFRELVGSDHMKVNDVIINSYMKNYVPPSVDEGFTEIVNINFVPNFEQEEDQRLYEMYLLEN